MIILRTDLDRAEFSDIEDTSAPRIDPIHPGEILRLEWLEPMGITPDRAAMDLAVPLDQLTAILAGDRPIAADIALRLARYFGTSAQSWINLQAQYDLELATHIYGEEIARQITKLDEAHESSPLHSTDSAMDLDAVRIECRTVSYRSGFIEVDGNIHPECVNLEVWNVNPDKAPQGVDVRADSFPDDAVTANVELELSRAEARALVSMLEAAIARI